MYSAENYQKYRVSIRASQKRYRQKRTISLQQKIKEEFEKQIKDLSEKNRNEILFDFFKALYERKERNKKHSRERSVKKLKDPLFREKKNQYLKAYRLKKKAEKLKQVQHGKQ